MGLAHLASGRRNDALGAYTARYAGIELVNSQTAGPRVTTIRAGRVAAPSLSSRALPPSAVAPPAASPRTRDAVNAADRMHCIDTQCVHLDAVVIILMDDFPKAALKHLQDGQALLESDRFDGAASLELWRDLVQDTCISLSRKPLTRYFPGDRKCAIGNLTWQRPSPAIG